MRDPLTACLRGQDEHRARRAHHPLPPLPVSTFILDDIVVAHLAVEGGAVGKVVVRP
jgi:hypothetical protein